LETAALLVKAPASEQLLAMKLSAWRDDLDIEDARLKARYAFDDLWEADREPQ
jgi:hypothetical protein